MLRRGLCSYLMIVLIAHAPNFFSARHDTLKPARHDNANKLEQFFYQQLKFPPCSILGHTFDR